MSANKVVFDPHWNPAYDLHAQDWAYRRARSATATSSASSQHGLGTTHIRFIRGRSTSNYRPTFLHGVRMALSSKAYAMSRERRYFKGVQNDKNHEGGIFGIANILFRKDYVILGALELVEGRRVKGGACWILTLTQLCCGEPSRRFKMWQWPRE
jgi:hypothetical protein